MAGDAAVAAVPAAPKGVAIAFTASGPGAVMSASSVHAATARPWASIATAGSIPWRSRPGRTAACRSRRTGCRPRARSSARGTGRCRPGCSTPRRRARPARRRPLPRRRARRVDRGGGVGDGLGAAEAAGRGVADRGPQDDGAARALLEDRDGRPAAPAPIAGWVARRPPFDERRVASKPRHRPGAAPRRRAGAIRLPRDGRVARGIHADLGHPPRVERERGTERAARPAARRLDDARVARPGRDGGAIGPTRPPSRAPAESAVSVNGGSHDGAATAGADASSAPAQSTIRKAERLTTRHPSPSGTRELASPQRQQDFCGLFLPTGRQRTLPTGSFFGA